MRDLLILGGGTAGTMVANKLRPKLDEDEWRWVLTDRAARGFERTDCPE